MKRFCLLLLTIAYSYSFAQTSSTDPRRQFTPQAPEAAAFNRYLDIPVSMHTGIPEISIPIYTIKMKDLNIPISLSYHASGVRIDEVAPNTGLGWSLVAGGNISQSVNGLDDLDAFGWVNTSPSELTPQSGLLKTFFGQGTTPYFEYDQRYFFNKRATEGMFLDTQPDVFYFSMPGKSGKFFFDQNGVAHLMSHQNIKVGRSSQAVGLRTYTLTDDQGFIYIYDQIETTAGIVSNNCSGIYWPKGSSSILLSKIITPKGDTVTYVYNNKSYSYRAQVSETRTLKIQGNNDCPNDTHCVDRSTVEINGKQLSEIIGSDGQRISFSYANDDRLDIVGNPALQRITIYSHAKQLQQYQMNYSYFISPEPSIEDPSLKYRLKLDQVVKNGEEVYSLEYDQTNMPLRLSFAQDHYGFYNGAVSNNTLLPINIDKGFSSGANRETNPTFAKVGSLTKITYPSGGHTTFEMESNTYPYLGNLSTVQQASHQLMASSEEFSTYSFTVPESGRDFKARWRISAYQGFVTLSGTNGFNPITFVGNSNGEQNIIHLNPGTYTIAFSYMTDPFDLSDDFFRINWTYDQLDTIVENRPTGGLRVKKMEFYGGPGTQPYSNNYSYASEFIPTQSSGRLMHQPQTEYESWQYSSSESELHNECRYLTQATSSVAPLGTISGGNIVYDHVSVYKTSQTESGMTSYTFLNAGEPLSEYNDPVINGIKYPFAPKVPNDGLNGLLTSVKTYAYDPIQQKMVMLKRKDNEYKTAVGTGPNEFSVRGVKIGVLLPSRCTGTVCSPIQFATDYYYLSSTWSYLTKETDSTFNVGLSPNVVTTIYHYDNPTHLQVTRKEVNTSTDGKRYTFISYPDDYLAGTTFIDELKAKNNLTATIEKVEYLSDNLGAKIIAGEIAEYRTGGVGLVERILQLNLDKINAANPFKFSNRPQGVLPNIAGSYIYQKDGRYEERFSFGPYDKNSNVLSISEKDGITTVYVWSYGGKYLIAEIKNAAYAVVEGLLGGTLAVQQLQEKTPTAVELDSVFNLLRNAPGLSESMITTYTYDPHVGITSQTDVKGQTVFYKYDDNGRLESIKNQDGNILKAYKYHFKD